MQTKLTFLGTGTSGGVPEISCTCAVCLSDNPKNKRLRTSVLISNENLSILIDCSADFRQQALQYKIQNLDAVLVTHTHHDHIAGVDDLRSITCKTGKMNIYIKDSEMPSFKKAFYYIFETNLQKGGGLPDIELVTIKEKCRFSVKDVVFEPLLVFHGIIPILGYKFGNTAYITDAKSLPDSTLMVIKGIDILIINALRYKPHKTHLNLEEALRIIETIKPRRAYLIHTTHDIDYEKISQELPENVFLAFDGLVLEDIVLN